MENDKYDLSDFTFMIPVMVESPERERNLKTVVKYLLHHFITNIFIVEQGNRSEVVSLLENKYDSVRSIVYDTEKTYFHKNKLLNICIQHSTTPYIVSYDSDILFYPMQYLDAAEVIRKKKADFCYPFDEGTYNMFKEAIVYFENNFKLEGVEEYCRRMYPDTPAPGGCLFMNKESFRKCGYENENFKSYGPEDRERVERVAKLGCIVERTSGPLFHLEHRKLKHSTTKHSFHQENINEYHKIYNMPKEQLIEYIKEWK